MENAELDVTPGRDGVGVAAADCSGKETWGIIGMQAPVEMFVRGGMFLGASMDPASAFEGKRRSLHS